MLKKKVTWSNLFKNKYVDLLVLYDLSTWSIGNSQGRKKLSSVSSDKKESADDVDDRKEQHMAGHIKFSTYKAFFKAALSNIYVLFVFLVFIATQFCVSGADFFLSVW